MADKKRVLILCTGNSARSQMAEGLLRHDAGDRFTVESAGTKPGTVRPEAIAVMKACSHSFDDPAIVQGTDEKRLGAFRTVWDELRAYLKDFPKNY